MAKKRNFSTLGSALGAQTTREEAIALLMKHPVSWTRFNNYPVDRQEELLDFLTGKKGINILYNSFFMHIFDPYLHPNRLEKLLSALLGKKVKIRATLPKDGIQVNEHGSFVIMDILVELEDGTIFNLEVQKIGYRFPGQRTSCYTADMIMRQYNKLRAESSKNHPFDYRNMKPVHILVLMQESSKEFKDAAPYYIHKRKVSYDSKAKVTELENVTYVSLDTFQEVVQNNIDTELHAWLTFLCSNEPEMICKLIEKDPTFIEIYQEIAAFRRSPEEVTGMFSEALLEMDRNTERFMLEEMKKEAQEELKKSREELNRSKDELSKSKDELSKSKDELSKSKDELNRMKAEMAKEREESKRTIELLQRKLIEAGVSID